MGTSGGVGTVDIEGTRAVYKQSTGTAVVRDMEAWEEQGREESIAAATVPGYLMPRPANAVAKALLKAPILAWRLGLGRLVGRGVLLLTTTGRKSGLPRRTALGFHEVKGRKYVFTLRGPYTDWYRNMLANPHVTIQTAQGSEAVVMRKVKSDEELGDAYEFLARIPVMSQWASSLGVELGREALIAHKDDLILITFEPTIEVTPPPLKADLAWVWAAVAVVGALLVSVVRHRGSTREIPAEPGR